MRNAVRLLWALPFIFASAAGGSEEPNVSFSLEVRPKTVLMGKRLRVRGFAVNRGEKTENLFLFDWSLDLLLDREPKLKSEIVWPTKYWMHASYATDPGKVALPPGKRVQCFELEIPTGNRFQPSTTARGPQRLRWTGRYFADAADAPKRHACESERLNFLLDDPKAADDVHAVDGLLIELEAVRKKVTSRKDVHLRLRLKNTREKPLEIFLGEQKRSGYTCVAFLIYAPGASRPVEEVLHLPAPEKGILAIAPGKPVEHVFTAAWGVYVVLVPSPTMPGDGIGHMEREVRETTFLKPGKYQVFAILQAMERAEENRYWTGNARSNSVTLELGPAKAAP